MHSVLHEELLKYLLYEDILYTPLNSFTSYDSAMVCYTLHILYIFIFSKKGNFKWCWSCPATADAETLSPDSDKKPNDTETEKKIKFLHRKMLNDINFNVKIV